MIKRAEAQRFGLEEATEGRPPGAKVSTYGGERAWLDYVADEAVRLIHAGIHAEVVEEEGIVSLWRTPLPKHKQPWERKL